MGFHECETCHGTGYVPHPRRKWWQLWLKLICVDCLGDGHQRPPGRSNLDGIEVWCVGKKPPEGEWEFQGVFARESEAAAACLDETWFIGPVRIGCVLPIETHEWNDAYYPLLVKVTA